MSTNVWTPDTTFAGLPVRKSNDMVRKGSTICIYGPPGSGKTLLASGAADSEMHSPVLFADAEGGSSVFSHRSDIDVITVRQWSVLRKIIDALKNDSPYRTLVLDNMSEIQQLNITSIAGQGNDIQIQHWNKSTADILNMTRTLLDHSINKGLNVIFLAWEDREKDSVSNMIRTGIGFTPSLANKFPGIIDIVGYLSVMNNAPHYSRLLSFAPSPKTDAKFRRSSNDLARSIPLQVVYGEDNLPMADLLDCLKGTKKFPAARYQPPQRG